MAPMPPEFYVPAFGALMGGLGILAGVVRTLYARNIVLSDQLFSIEREVSALIALDTEALRANEAALTHFANTTSRGSDGSEIRTRARRVVENP